MRLPATFFRHGSTAVLALVAAALVAVFVTGRLVPSPLFGVAGALAFFVSEYATHRYLLHAPPLRRSAVVLRLQHRLHYDHHVTPTDLSLLFLPLWFALPATALATALYWTLTRSAAFTLSLLLGSVLGLLYYEWVHYVAHVAFVPKTPFGRWMKRYHLRHHYKNERMWFGVTNPGLDLALRTWARTSDAPRSATVRVLFPK